jgi:hypothetical protein
MLLLNYGVSECDMEYHVFYATFLEASQSHNALMMDFIGWHWQQQGGVFKCLSYIKLDGIKNPCFFTFMLQFAKMGTF